MKTAETPWTIKQFINHRGIRIRCTRTDDNPNMIDPSYWRRHWLCPLLQGDGTGRELRVYFSQGDAHTKAPTAADVLDCLASDAASVFDKPFDVWADNMGYDSDSRKAHKLYKTIQRQSERLKAFLGSDYNTLLWDVERL